MLRVFKSFLSAFSVISIGLIGATSSQTSAVASGTTNPATSITQGGAILNGTIAHDASAYTAVFAISPRSDFSGPIFDYGSDRTSDHIIFVRSGYGGNILSGTQQHSFDLNEWTPTAGSPSLQPSTTYYYRIGIQTGPDTVPCIWTNACYSWGNTVSFTTRAAILPTVSSNDASLIGADIATISGVVTSNDAATQVRAEYSNSSNFANSVFSDPVTVARSATPTTVSRSLTALTPSTKYFFRLVASNLYGTSLGQAQSFETTPPIGISINNAANYSTSKDVTLSVSWPVGATSMTISNDGGFRGDSVKSMSLARSVEWSLDDSISGLYTKIVYVRFSGAGIDASRSYSDDIIFDNRPPSVTTSKGELAGSYVIVSLAAQDQESGLSTVEVKHGNKTVSAAYSPTVLLKASTLGLSASASSSSVRSQGLSQVQFRIADKAGNKTSWITLGGRFISKANSPKPEVSGGRAVSGKSIADYLKVSTPKGSRITLKVSAQSKRFCRVSGTSITAIRAGNCSVSVTVRSGKTSTTRTTTLKVKK